MSAFFLSFYPRHKKGVSLSTVFTDKYLTPVTKRKTFTIFRQCPFSPCDHICQVSESARTRLGAIIFRNYYCSHITIKQRWESNGNIGAAATCGGIGGTVESDPWVTVLRDRALMTDPHFEDDAQDWHVITVEEFDQGKYDADSTAQLRYNTQRTECRSVKQSAGEQLSTFNVVFIYSFGAATKKTIVGKKFRLII